MTSGGRNCNLCITCSTDLHGSGFRECSPPRVIYNHIIGRQNEESKHLTLGVSSKTIPCEILRCRSQNEVLQIGFIAHFMLNCIQYLISVLVS